MRLNQILKPDKNGNYFTIYDAPIMFFLDLTQCCNLKCWFCYDQTNRSVKHGDIDVIKSIIKVMGESGSEEVVYLGGEPLLHPQLFEILQYGQEMGLNQTIVSNGIRIDEDFAKKLSRVKDISIGISLHSHIEKIHDHISQVSGAWKKTIKAIHNLQKYNVPWYTQTSIVHSNYKELLDFSHFIKSIGNPLRMDLSRIVACECTYKEDRFLSKPEYTEVFRQLNEIEDVKCRIEAFPRCWLKELCKENNLNYKKLKTIIRPCYTWIAQLSIDCFGNGRLWPTGGETLGNVLRDGLDTVWKNNKEINHFRKFEWINQKCVHCEDFYYCVGGCKRTKEGHKFTNDIFQNK
jgi:radical SAM protein with 4Fe4S-binding SPASM domain